MPYIQVEKDGLLYEAEYFYEDGMVTVFGIRGGQSSVDLNGMTRPLLHALLYEILLEKTK